MTTTSDEDCSDQPIDMAINDSHTPSPQPTTTKETNPKEFCTLHLKFEFRAKNDDLAVDAVHRELLFEIANNCEGTLFYNNIDDNNNCIDPFTASEELLETSFNYQKFKRSNYDLHCFAHSIAT